MKRLWFGSTTCNVFKVLNAYFSVSSVVYHPYLEWSYNDIWTLFNTPTSWSSWARGSRGSLWMVSLHFGQRITMDLKVAIHSRGPHVSGRSWLMQPGRGHQMLQEDISRKLIVELIIHFGRQYWRVTDAWTVRFTRHCKLVTDIDMDLVLWIWSARTRTHTKSLVLVLSHFYSTRTRQVKYSYSYSYSDFVYSSNPGWVSMRFSVYSIRFVK